MDEPIPTPAPTPPPATPRRPRIWFWLVAALIAIAAGCALWWTTFDARREHDSEVAALRGELDALNRTVEQLRGNAQTLRARLDDGEKVDKSMREQLLGLGERAHLVEDALANPADKRLSGRDALALDEAELLLSLGGERYVLFHDRTAAVAAYGQADIALSQVEDAAFSTVRQSIAAEIAALNDTHVADAAVLTMQLAGLRAQASLWPTSARALSAPAPPPESRLARVLGAFVQVRHNDAAQTRAALHAPNLARELFLIDLREAEAATLARDETRYRAALEAARTELPVAFDVQVPAVAAAANELDGLARAALAPPAPPLLGAALKELRNLRATHALREAQPAARAAGERK